MGTIFNIVNSQNFSELFAARPQRISTAGFTLLESLVVIGILALIGVAGLASFVSSRNTRDLSSAGQNVLSILKVAQSKALAGEVNSEWGVHLEQAQFVLFRGPTYAGAPYTEVFPLPGNIEIVNIALFGGGSDVIFKKIDGRTAESGTLTLRVRNAVNIAFPITIDSSGKVYQTGTAPAPAGSRIIDTRHRTFNLNGTIKNAVTMTLTFSDPPNPDIIFPVAMTPLPPRTTFDWTGVVTVGGQAQTLRIHALSITDSATSLSVDRDCRQNTKQVKISFDLNDVATYSADCKTITVHSFGGTVLEP